MSQQSTPAATSAKRRTGKPRRVSSPILGEERIELRKKVVAMYPPEGIYSIRAIATKVGRSYGFVNTLLHEAGLLSDSGSSATGEQS